MTGDALDRPAIVTDDHLLFLDALRDSGKINMFGARPHVIRAFGLSEEDAATVHLYWMNSYGDRHAG